MNPLPPKNTRRRLSDAGFTLVEMLVVLAIVALLIGMLFPAIGSAKERGRQTACASNLRQLGIAFRLYQDENEGKYPYSWNPVDGDANNWQSSLVDSNQGGIYLGDGLMSYTNSGGTDVIRIKAKLLCPTVVQNLRITDPHDKWGYCYDVPRTDISYAADDPPWCDANYMNVNLDTLYNRPSKQAVLACGNGASYQAPEDWDATVGATAPLWNVIPVHGDFVNVLFLDAHVQAMKLKSASDKTDFNRVWYSQIPVATGCPANPYFDD